jgi:hypothetical protein
LATVQNIGPILFLSFGHPALEAATATAAKNEEESFLLLFLARKLFCRHSIDIWVISSAQEMALTNF